MNVRYSSNNSGGDWWLTDEDWLALERAGWSVEWGGLYFCRAGFQLHQPPVGFVPCAAEKCEGHRRYESYEQADANPDGRFLDAAATAATIEADSMATAVRQWETVTGKDATDNGCGCCGPPHSFSAEGQYASGDDLVAVLHPGAPTSLREAARRLTEGA